MKNNLITNKNLHLEIGRTMPDARVKMSVRLPILNQKWYMDVLDTHYQQALSKDKQWGRKKGKSSSNSAFSSQDSGGQDGTPQTQTSGGSQGNQVTNSHVTSQVVDGLQGIGQQMSSDDLKQFERKLEREREKRLHTEPPPPVRIDSRVLSENVPSCDFNMRRNGFRPTSKNTFMTRGEQNVSVAAFRHTHASSMDPLNSLSITNTGSLGGVGGGATQSASSSGAPGMLRGQSMGFGSREGLATSGLNNSGSGGGSGSQGRLGKARRSYFTGQSEKNRQNQYQFQDPASGATSDFQQRLSELTSLESDTIRYERTKKAKKKSKQDSG